MDSDGRRIWQRWSCMPATALVLGALGLLGNPGCRGDQQHPVDTELLGQPLNRQRHKGQVHTPVDSKGALERSRKMGQL